MKYIVTAYKFEKTFANEEEARNCFEEVKTNFTYCEMKKVENINGNHCGEAIEIYSK